MDKCKAMLILIAENRLEYKNKKKIIDWLGY